MDLNVTQLYFSDISLIWPLAPNRVQRISSNGGEPLPLLSLSPLFQFEVELGKFYLSSGIVTPYTADNDQTEHPAGLVIMSGGTASTALVVFLHLRGFSKHRVPPAIIRRCRSYHHISKDTQLMNKGLIARFTRFILLIDF